MNELWKWKHFTLDRIDSFVIYFCVEHIQSVLKHETKKSIGYFTLSARAYTTSKKVIEFKSFDDGSKTIWNSLHESFCFIFSEMAMWYRSMNEMQKLLRLWLAVLWNWKSDFVIEMPRMESDKLCTERIQRCSPIMNFHSSDSQ